ncbi:MAG: cell division protein SepF [Candidatus Woesearchaeota archaeon]
MAIKNAFLRNFGVRSKDEEEEEYLEITAESFEDNQKKVLVRAYSLSEFEDIKPILNDLRLGYIICFVNIKNLKEKDPVELKRAIQKFKIAIDNFGGDIAGVGEDWIIITPSFAEIDKSKKAMKQQEEEESNDEEEEDF